MMTGRLQLPQTINSKTFSAPFDLTPQTDDPAEMAIILELERRREENRCRYFEPNGAQENFVRLFGSPDNDFVKILSAANGIGKSTIIANLISNIIWGPQNSFFDYPLFKEWPYPKRLRFITDPKLVEESGPFHTEVKKWWPRDRYTAHKGGKTYYSHYKANGFYVDIMSNDQALKEFEGHTLGAVIFDEPPVRAIWNASLARLRMGGVALVCMTPLTGAGWFFDEVIPRHQASVVYGDIEENCKVHGVRGQLEHINIERMIAEMDPEEREARAHGKAMYLQGLVFKAFDPKVHILDQHIRVPSNAQIWQIVDPHGDKPFASIWGFCDGRGDLYQVDEWPNEDFYRMHNCDLGVSDYKRVFLNKEQGWRVTKRIMDRHFADVRTVNERKTLREAFAAVGLNYDLSYFGGVEEVDGGVLKVKDYLRWNTAKPIDEVNRPRYYVSPQCTNTIKSFQRWAIDPKTGNYKDDFKDFMDCVRYWVMANPRPYEAVPTIEPKRMYG